MRLALVCCLSMIAVLALWRGLSLLLFRRPAVAHIIYDGYREERARADAAFIRDHAPPMPIWVEDRVAFTDTAGNEVRADVRRLAVPAGATRIVWFDPRRPDRFTSDRPLLLITLGLIAIAGVVLLLR